MATTEGEAEQTQLLLFNLIGPNLVEVTVTLQGGCSFTDTRYWTIGHNYFTDSELASMPAHMHGPIEANCGDSN